jgi:outer membrane receptor protein involved in Fe transport
MLYAGVEGDLNKNSYQSIVERNPFVSPTLEIQPTDNAYTGFLGLNGSLEKFGYNFKVFGRQDNSNLFFVENPVTSGGFASFVPVDNYEFSNSFQVLYDDMFTLGVNAEATYSVLDDFDVGLSASYFNYSVDNLPEASNLPELELSLNAKYKIGEKWYLSSTLFYVGERESLGYMTGPADGIDLVSQTVDGFVDFNLGLNYQLSERLGIFINGQNLFDNNYQYWRNFDVQGIQVMGGLSYQFDW